MTAALYGHPDSVSFWEQHCNEQVSQVGFHGFGAEWPFVLYHAELKLLLTIYVDDFKLAGPEQNLSKSWDLLRQRIDIGPASRTGMYLGCNIIKQQIRLGSGKTANAVVYDMESFLGQCVDKYLHVAGCDIPLRNAKTPFLHNSGADSVYRCPSTSDEAPCKWCGFTSTDVATTSAPEKTKLPEGKLASVAAGVLMKCLYAARMCRFDLLRAVQGLARYMTKWTTRQDQELHQQNLKC
jgi:hypothetical protein